MRSPHLLRAAGGPAAFAPLIAAARAAGLRVGWLQLAPPGPAPPALDEAAAAGVLRAVGVGEGRSVAVKPLAGPAVLRDLVREHFRGCALLLVDGPVEAPVLAPVADAWRLETAGAPPRLLTTDGLLARLRRPRPW